MVTLRYWFWCVAIGVGVFLGLLFASVTGMASDTFTTTVRVQHFAPGTLGELETFQLHTKDGTITLMGDADLPVIRFMLEQKGKMVEVGITPRREFERISR